MSDEKPISIDQVILACSNAKLSDGTLMFNSFGSEQVRLSTQEFLDNNGLTLEDAEAIIHSLTINDFIKGPVDNYIKERKIPLWIFKKKYNQFDLYIKLLVFNKRRCVAVISLHN